MKEGSDHIEVVIKVLQMVEVERRRQRNQDVGNLNQSHRRKLAEKSTVAVVLCHPVILPQKMMVVKQERVEKVGIKSVYQSQRVSVLHILSTIYFFQNYGD